ncbi:ATP-grasp domain-containing protein [Bdellovibrio sp. HCB185ZH]|uniref:ATP-grasp domain-containing protein n=1 Tax=Bdellovibrio sp. HCB185ZH TaxID=3394235 RepID=UPI0039A48BCC
MSKVAVFFQSEPPPAIDGIKKPFKPGGYSDSGADIAYALKESGQFVATPVAFPEPQNDKDWVFPDNEAGFTKAYEAGARIFWLNTVLYVGHPVETLKFPEVKFVGQRPSDVQAADDKFATNKLLRERGLPVASSEVVQLENWQSLNLATPMMIKPIRGRGSQGVEVVKELPALKALVEKWKASGEFGDALMAEEFLPGEEITITVMPAGTYRIQGETVVKGSPWALPPVRRVNHIDGVAPYNGVVAVTANSVLLSPVEAQEPSIQSAIRSCERAGTLLEIHAPIRIDCRQNSAREYLLFDLNMKPNMTGPGRPGRDNQDSLSAIAARGIGWDYKDLLLAMLEQAWKMVISSQGYLRK